MSACESVGLWLRDVRDESPLDDGLALTCRVSLGDDGFEGG